MREQISNTIAETESFIKRASALWSPSELDSFKDFIAANPLAGDEIQGTGGLRKIRWSRAGMGKRGGARVIYYFYNQFAPLYLIHIYAKAEKENLTAQEKAAFSQFVDILKTTIKQRLKEK